MNGTRRSPLLRACGPCLGTVWIFCAFLGAQEGAPAGRVTWHRSLDEAVRTAISKQRPVLVHFNSDGDAQSNEIVRAHLQDPKVLELGKKFIWTVASPDSHVPAGDLGPCPRFPGVRCKEHQRAWSVTSLCVSGSPVPTASQFVFLRPDRTQILRRVGIGSSDELVGAMEQALEYFEGAARHVDPDLLSLFEEANANRDTIRRAALRKLVHEEHPEVVAFLGQQMKSEAGEVKRQEAIKAMKAARNVNCLPHMIPLLFEASGQLRRNAVFALRNLGLSECVPGFMECYARENTNRMKALIIRTAARMAPKDKKLLSIHRQALKSGPPMLRIHAIRACVDLEIAPAEFTMLIEMARAGTSMRVQALSCWAATEILLRQRKPQVVIRDKEGEQASDGYERVQDRPFAKEILVLTPKLGHALRQVAEAGRTEAIRKYAAECVKALDGEPSQFRTAINEFHEDAKDEVFKEY